MARENLKAELERYLGLAEEDARAYVARTYQQEVILHVDDWTDSMLKSWNAQAPANSTDKVDRRKTKSNTYQNLKGIFDAGAQATIDSLHRSLPRLKSDAQKKLPGGGSSYSSMGQLKTFKHKGMLAIYLISPTIFNWESDQFSSAMSRGKNKGLKVINDKLELQGKRTLRGGKGANSATKDLWGHHGGITGSDPHSTYGLAGITKASEELGKDPNLFVPVVDENNKLDSYSDVFWKSVGDAIDTNAYWEAKYDTRRPTRTKESGLTDKHIMRIVFGHRGFKGVQGGFDKGGKGWTKLGPTLDALLKDIRKDVEDDINAQLMAEGRQKADMSGSETPRTRVGKLAAESVVRNLVRETKKGAKGSKGSVKVTSKVDRVKKSGKQRSKITAKGKKPTSKSSSRRGARVPVKTKKKARGQTKGRSSVSMNPIGLQQLLNKALPEEVMKNMGPYPRRLENRTGRFAGSAEVTQVVPMPNSVEIRYNYQQDPYSVFEPGSGNPLASPGRDPRKLIGGTIRELAQSIMGTKYGLVRTKRV